MSKHNLEAADLAYNQLADRFDNLMNAYDIQRRLEVLIDEFLQGIDLKGKLILEAGCGTGRGSQQLSAKGGQVIALDIGFNLVRYARQRCLCEPTTASVLNLPFPDDTFDIVFSTEVIEHTPRPLEAAQEMYRIVKPRGHLIISTPNWLWQWPVRLASAVKLRPYNGLENFVKPLHLQTTLEKAGATVVCHKGIHLFPFQLSAIQPLLRRLDAYGELLLPVMINQCLHCIKPSAD